MSARDISKRSIGVGSLCIDDTIEESKMTFINSSIAAKSSTKSAKRGGLRDSNKKAKLIVKAEESKKRYLSSDAEQATVPQTKLPTTAA